ncbi:membrane protein insertion efficiency factor YidD [Blastococcus sp. BMG 814]|uniref:Putative membrane protein insertion efficiency factor n=1 Tax=Blastococcus carthaginiensis TaxID=3050034 RepID=A0ABT9IHW8_9ACTN|nr:membrane protein insertion efficiency factor YidD [Blastococcus carthaginiensis]MDP5185173.1 membrane protein insertion efficiency factor YidD [Blastococcus carthaginiensis]
MNAPNGSAPRRSAAARLLLCAVGFYSRAISPAFPPRCRFHPTCSAYAAEAVGRHGAARGSRLALVRLAKCAPWHPGGVDPVPPARGTGTGARSSSSAARPQVAPSDDPGREATPPAACRTPQEESSVA